MTMKLPKASSGSWMFARFALVMGGLFMMQYHFATNFDRNEVMTWMQVAAVLVGYDLVQWRKAKKDEA